MNNNLELLLNSTIVDANLTQELLDAKQDLYTQLDGAKHEAINYIKELMGKEDFSIELSIPDKGFWVLHLSCLEDNLPTYKFPFGFCSENLWLKLVADNENPVFKLLRYLECNAKKLRGILDEKNIEVDEESLKDFNLFKQFDSKVLELFDIFDAFNLISFLDIYKDMSEYLNDNEFGKLERI